MHGPYPVNIQCLNCVQPSVQPTTYDDKEYECSPTQTPLLNQTLPVSNSHVEQPVHHHRNGNIQYSTESTNLAVRIKV